ncbi:hypothetical protein [uncultured Megasphaera sp.]|uniref:hypothetical protein n=1 Tax=uncultured Megasphaera sp. TaxID=165188 RepID=UPI00265ABD46|nr:hypothetical protein [uncultured Megasphaera sp.]
MNKLKRFLWGVVAAYLIYAMVVEGPTPALLGLTAAAVFVCVMHWWMGSDLRRRMKEKEKRDDS